MTKEQKQYILEHENKDSLQDIALHLNCSWKKIYIYYSRMIKTGEFQEYMRGKFCERVKNVLNKVKFWSKLPAHTKEELTKMSNEELNFLINQHIEELEQGILPTKEQSTRIIKALKMLQAQNDNLEAE